MTNQKLYALRTIPLPGEKGEWVRYEDDSSIVLSEQEDNSDLESLLAIKNTGKPCKWVEVWVIEAKPVTEEVIESILTAQETIGMETPYQFTESLQVKKAQITWRVGFCNGFRACLRYLGVG